MLAAQFGSPARTPCKTES